MDVGGLVESGRAVVQDCQKALALAHDHVSDGPGAIEALRPTALIGVSTVGKRFNRAVIEAMARLNPRPIIFACSNTTSRSECTAQEAYEWSEGRAIFGSGSPFAPVQWGGKTFVP